MGEGIKLDQAIVALALLGPGFLIMFGRSRFLTGRMTSVASSVFEYLMVSSIYFATAYPLFQKIELGENLSLFLFLVVFPLVIGLSLGIISQKDWFRGPLTRWLNLNPVHTSPTGWDYIFGNRTGFSWVVVKLNSGGRYYGVFGPDSLASSDLSRRDIFLEDTCNEKFEFTERDGRKRGVWISESEIKSIEIIKD